MPSLGAVQIKGKRKQAKTTPKAAFSALEPREVSRLSGELATT